MRLHKLLIALGLLTACAVADVGLVQAADKTTEVKFAAGGDHASYSGQIRGDDTARYTIGARRGQTLKVRLRADNGQAYFNVRPAGSQTALFVGSTGGDRFEGQLPSNGTYVVEVYLMRAAARRNETASFSLDIGIPATAAVSPPQDFADGNAGGPDNWIVTGVAANDRLNVRVAPNADAQIVGRLRNGAIVRNLGCQSVGGSRWCRVSARGEGGVHGWTNGRFLTESGDAGYEPADVDNGLVRSAKCKEQSLDCIRKAEAACSGDFRTLHSESHAGGLLNDKIPGPVTWYYLEYQCGYADGRMPQFPFRGPHYAREIPDSDDDADSWAGDGVDEAAMRRTCRQSAASEFGQRPKHVLVLPVERNGDGYLVYGQYPEDGADVTTFRCKFNRLGRLKNVRTD